MKKEWFLVVLAIGLAAVLNGCCSCKKDMAGGMVPSAQAGTYEPAQAQSGTYGGSRAIK